MNFSHAEAVQLINTALSSNAIALTGPNKTRSPADADRTAEAARQDAQYLTLLLQHLTQRAPQG